MKTIIGVTIFKCDFCKKNMQREYAMKRHEEHCSMNPKNIAKCSGCVFLEVKVDRVYYDNMMERRAYR